LIYICRRMPPKVPPLAASSVRIIRIIATVIIRSTREKSLEMCGWIYSIHSSHSRPADGQRHSSILSLPSGPDRTQFSNAHAARASGRTSLSITPQSATVTFSLVLPDPDPTCSMASTTFCPTITFPNTTCLPSRCDVLAVQMKN